MTKTIDDIMVEIAKMSKKLFQETSTMESIEGNCLLKILVGYKQRIKFLLRSIMNRGRSRRTRSARLVTQIIFVASLNNRGSRVFLPSKSIGYVTLSVKVTKSNHFE